MDRNTDVPSGREPRSIPSIPHSDRADVIDTSDASGDDQPPSLAAVIDGLRTAGAERISIVIEDESGHKYVENGEVLLEVKTIYDRVEMEDRLRGRLEDVGDVVRWNGRKYEFDARVADDTVATDSLTVYGRFNDHRATTRTGGTLHPGA
ncbi:hypothetical protein [Natrialbaceae archaeon AArc-T1-2]|uniref:hypothetical protein n=1 Tax=Natrialbaceae archaeon AArc-T1-2 TaxID=3053904 RepID=UPI00255ABBC9|nr:hypothetical protein [Natrialbaceae archaeon AArc-T1-2]WIV68185.1 hypothetical protein QQ977_05510 [Natrialbaceae archaeon AArc-T1-2]